MARDQALLEMLCEASQTTDAPVLMVRTYLWDKPTLSLGKNQPEADHERLLALFSKGEQASALQTRPDLVIRPTGGRAILHHQDISFAFITNAPVFLKLSLKDSYCVFTLWLKQALNRLGYPTQTACNANNRDYLRSPLCFDTHTPSDILGPDGKKLAGCAQARRSRGILQHGSAFLSQPPEAIYDDFSQALFGAVSQAFGQEASCLKT
ncbi:MAG: hypothetical protein VKJ04_11005 [Vampirovibrionales bacterium]|nr:hypothetical protein [Vampirovibrionales bacterium]